MEWDNVRIFLAIARSGQMLAASRQLGISHGTVARRLATLEKKIRVKLFDRHTTGCILTEDGKKFFNAAVDIEDRFLKAESIFSSTEDLSGAVRIGVSDAFGVVFLSRELKDFVLQHRDLRIQLVPLPLKVSTARRDIEIALTVGRPQESQLVAKKLTDCQLSIYASRDYLKRHGGIANREDLANHLLVTFPPEFSLNPDYDLAVLSGTNMLRRFECANGWAQMEAIRNGVGIGLLHDYIAGTCPDLEVVLPELRARRSYWIATHVACRGFPRIKRVLDFIETRIKQRRAELIPPTQVEDTKSRPAGTPRASLASA